MRVLAYCDSPFMESGFAQVAKQILGYLQSNGHEVTVVSTIRALPKTITVGWADYAVQTNISVVDLVANDYLNVNTAKKYIETAGYDILFTLHDPEVTNMLIDSVRVARKKHPLKWISYTPIDSDFYYPSQGAVKGVYETFYAADVPVLYTNYGYNTVVAKEPALATKLKVIYHGTDVNTFHKLSTDERRKLRKDLFNITNDDTKLIINVNRNQWRKDLGRSLEIFDQYYCTNSDSVLYLHTKPTDIGGNLFGMTQYFPKSKHAVKFNRNFELNVGVSREQLNQYYNCADALLTTSVGEGWGLSVTEAMAASLPVLAPDHTSFREILGNNRGTLLTLEDNFSFFYETSNNAARRRVHVTSAVDSLQAIFSSATSDSTKAAREWVETYSWENINNQWLELFETTYAQISRNNANNRP